MIPTWLGKAFGQKIQEPAKGPSYSPNPDRPVGDWLIENRVWVCDCFPNLGRMQHQSDQRACLWCDMQRPADIDFLSELTED